MKKKISTLLVATLCAGFITSVYASSKECTGCSPTLGGGWICTSCKEK